MKLRIFNIIIFLLLFNSIFYAQNASVSDLKLKQERYLKEISRAKKLLTKKGKTRISYLNQVKVLNAQINAQNELISTYEEEINDINSQILINQNLVSKLNKDIGSIKEGYKQLILEANKNVNSNYNEFMLLFSSNSFSEAYRRFQLLKQYSSYRKRQGIILVETKLKHDSIISYNKIILKDKQEKYKVLKTEIDNLKKSISEKNNYVQKLKSDERWLKKEIKNKETSSKKLQLQIEKLIAEAAKENKNFGFSNFSKAKGKLNWPVRNGVITNYFGEHNHAVLKGVKIKNNGIDITTAKENEVKCVYEGTVSRVIAIPGYNKAVIIRHGKFLTVYANLASVNVKNGQDISSNQSIGQIFADDNNKNGILHFEIWEENKKINPVDWLIK